MFRKIDHIYVWVRSVLNSSWNCFSYSDKVCMVLCIKFNNCFIWCFFLPPSTKAIFPFYDPFVWFQGLFLEVIILMVGTEVIVAWWEFVILQNDLFSLIRFLSLKCQFYFAMPHFCCFRGFFASDTLLGVFLLVLWLRRAFKIEFSCCFFFLI